MFLSSPNPVAMPRITALVLSLVAIAAISPLHAQAAQADSAAALRTVEQFHAALAAGDSSAAVALLSSDVLILESGSIQTRSQYLGGHLGADMKASQGSKAERAVVQVTMAGGAAYVVSKTVSPPTGAAGNTGSEMVELMIVSRAGPGWQIRAVHWSSRRRRP